MPQGYVYSLLSTMRSVAIAPGPSEWLHADAEELLSRAEAEATFGVDVELASLPIVGRFTEVEPGARLAGRAGRSLGSLRSVGSLRTLCSGLARGPCRSA